MMLTPEERAAGSAEVAKVREAVKDARMEALVGKNWKLDDESTIDSADA